MVSKGQFVGLDWHRIARLHSQVTTGTHEQRDAVSEFMCASRYLAV